MDRSKKTYIIHNLGKSFLKENSYHNAHAKHFFNISKYEWKLFHDKVEKIVKGSLDSILSLPSVKIQIMGGKFAWGVKAKHCCQQTFDNQKFVDISNVLPYYLKQTFLPIIWIFTESEGDGIESRLSS